MHLVCVGKSAFSIGKSAVLPRLCRGSSMLLLSFRLVDDEIFATAVVEDRTSV